MRISIVTISFNQAQFLEQALCSVIEQDYKDLEYIVVDPGSTDGSCDIIQRYRSRIDKMIFEPDKGAADGLNKGFALATGQIFGFLNSDDALLPGALIRVAQFFVSHPGVDVVSGHARIIDCNDTTIRISHSDHFSALSYAYGGAVLMQPSTFFRREIFLRCNGFNVQNRSNWDGELFVDMALHGARFATVNEVWSGYRLHTGSITGSGKQHDAMLRYERRIFEKIMGRPPWISDRLVMPLFRVAKHARNPRGLVERLRHGPVYRRMS